MALSRIKFTRVDGNLRAPLLGQDHISGLLFDVTTAPGTTALGDVSVIYSVSDAEKLGITPFSTDEGDTPYQSGLPHLHISEYFRLNPNGTLYVCFENCTTQWEALANMQRVAQGAIRQIGIWTPKKLWVLPTGEDVDADPYTLDLVQDLENVANTLADQNQPFSILLQANTVGIEADGTSTNIVRLPDAVQSYSRITTLIGQGNTELVRNIQLAITDHPAVGWVGACLATVALAGVGESIAWVGKFNIAGGNMNSIAMGFGNTAVADDEFGTLLPYESLSEQQLDTLDDRGYVFPRKYTDKDGTFVSKDRTCSNGDYRTISRNRTIDKSRREVRKVLLDRLNSPLNIDPSNGTLANKDIKTFKALVSDVLDVMQNNGEISGYYVNIDATQNVLTTDKLIIQYRLIPKGVASDIDVEEGFALSTSTAAAEATS